MEKSNKVARVNSGALFLPDLHITNVKKSKEGIMLIGCHAVTIINFRQVMTTK